MKLDRPFFVLATQNPIEQEGTYPLPEAQLDRFMLELRIGYPTREEEEQVAMQTTGSEEPVGAAGARRGGAAALQKLVRRVPAPPSLVSYAVRLARATRPDDEAAPELIRRYVAGERVRGHRSIWCWARRRARR
jgi:MoxR-like ATPase